ncbi:ATP-binding protein [Hyphomicrobium sp.]|uniref:ATP-binding protein n=1 Tax=Hyphomicrobium sp. TaxID=82 RepID=UPI000FBAEE0B|nr:ATP-binding protein [Hyphomicrobium sp.]RUO98523.1 MAG: HAMP domain-containing protein [Hyphomicrobium sp.]
MQSISSLFALGRRLKDAAWFGRSIRQQVLLAISAMLVLATIVMGTTAVLNGRQSVNVEIEASMDTAEGYLRELVRRIAAENRLHDLDDLVAREIQHLRHARVYVQDPGKPMRLLRAPETISDIEDADDRTPDWFEHLMMPAGGNDHTRVINVEANGRYLILKGDPDDEIAEKWEQLSAFSTVALIAIALIMAAFYFVLGRILRPLTALARGLVALEAGERSQRIDIPKVSEVADIAVKFNSLACSLDQARAENGELYRQIQSVQEEERREIARELHDEAGPCLFGITANAESIVALAHSLKDNAALQIGSRTEEILSIAARMKAMNRALLKRLHPVSVGKVPLSALIQDLAYDFERRHPDVRIRVMIALSDKTYGERIDLTVYRSTQEALTNAVRHGQAENVIVEMREVASGDNPENRFAAKAITLRVSDDGIGLKPDAEAGFGLSAMKERVLAAGGSLTITGEQPRGTTILIRIPLQPVRSNNGISHNLTRVSA